MSDRRALRSVALQFFANGTVYATVIPRLPDIRERVDISIGTLGLVLMLGSVASLIGSLLTARVIGRLGSRRVMIWGSIFSIGFLPVIGFSTSPIVLVVALFGLLFFDVFIDVAMNMQGSVLSARRHTPVMNRLHGLWSLGSVAGGILTVLTLRAGVSTPVHLSVVAVLLLVALLIVAPGLLRTDEAPQADLRTDGVPQPVAAPDVVAAPAGSDTSTGDRPARSPHRPFGLAALLLGLSGAMAMTIEIANGDWASFRLGEDLGARPGVAALAFLAFTSGMTIGRLGGDYVQVRVGPLTLIRMAAVIAGVGSVFATLVPSQAVSIAGFFVAGLGGSVLFPQLYDRAAKWPGPPGSGFAPMLIGQRGAGLLVPLLVGALADTATLDVGQAIAILVIPATIVVLLTTFATMPTRATSPTPPT